MCCFVLFTKVKDELHRTAIFSDDQNIPRYQNIPRHRHNISDAISALFLHWYIDWYSEWVPTSSSFKQFVLLSLVWCRTWRRRSILDIFTAKWRRFYYAITSNYWKIWSTPLFPHTVTEPPPAWIVHRSIGACCCCNTLTLLSVCLIRNQWNPTRFCALVAHLL